jgi:hypothetical protein
MSKVGHGPTLPNQFAIHVERLATAALNPAGYEGTETAMNRLTAAARKLPETFEASLIAEFFPCAANDNDESFDALAHDVVAILLSPGPGAPRRLILSCRARPLHAVLVDQLGSCATWTSRRDRRDRRCRRLTVASA